MIFDRREWLTIVTAGLTSMLGKGTMIELPEDDEESSPSEISCGGTSTAYSTMRCDGCGNHFPINTLRYYQIQGTSQPNGWHVCECCYWYFTSNDKNL